MAACGPAWPKVVGNDKVPVCDSESYGRTVYKHGNECLTLVCMVDVDSYKWKKLGKAPKSSCAE